MTGDRIAVIDLGSNTFHLLICEVNPDGSWSALLKERVYVKLASGGLDHIDTASTQRGVDAMNQFAAQIKTYDVKQSRAIGTAALREAKNGKQVADRMSLSSGLQIEIIDGQQEADYILRGIQSAIPSLDAPGLIMDIGGGSVEFILFDDHSILFKGSYKIGVAVLFRNYHHSDPIDEQEIKALEKTLENELKELIQVVRSLPGYYLIGASGSFEVLNDVLRRIHETDHWSELEMKEIIPYMDKVIHADLATRRILPEIPAERVDYIVVAYLLVRHIIVNILPDKLYYCDFALKEGVLDEMIEK